MLTFLTYKNRLRELKKNEETEEYVPNKRTGQNQAGNLSKTKICNMPNREFKVMIIKILAGFEKKVEDMSVTIKKDKE